MNKSNFSLYDDFTKKTEDNNSISLNDSIVYLNFNDELPDLIKPIREALEDKPSKFKLNIYIICGFSCNRDIALFINYLKPIQEEFDITFFIRGIIHPEFIGLLLAENVLIESGVKLIYNQSSLHGLMKNLMKRPDLFRKFVQRFIDVYHQYPQETLLDVTELELLGFQINKF